MRIKNEGNCKIIGKVAHFSGCARWAESVRSTREQICPIGEQNFYVVTAILRTLSFVLTNGRFVRRSWPFCMFQLRERAQFQSVQIVPEKKRTKKVEQRKKEKQFFFQHKKSLTPFEEICSYQIFQTCRVSLKKCGLAPVPAWASYFCGV